MEVCNTVDANIITKIKQENMDAEETVPDDVTTHSPEQLFAEGKEHKEIKIEIKEELEIKYANTEDYLDIGETVISEQDRAAPATSSTDESLLVENKSMRTQPKTPLQEKIYKCGVCDYQCMRRTNLLLHLKTHTFECEITDESNTGKELIVHIKTHPNERPYKCETCDYRSLTNTGLKRHMRTHMRVKPFKCDACDYECITSSHLKRHIRTHTGEKPFSCKICDYKCTTISYLKTHVRRHTGEKPFKCEACDYQSATNSDLKKHIRTHTGEKPYKCDTCNYHCITNHRLKAHMKTHTWKPLNSII